MIPSLTIGDLMIDCADAERARNFYADLMSCEKTVAYNCPALITENGLTILFAETEISYVPPVWPEEPGEQQKQMHLDFTVDDLPSAVNEAVRLGATKPAAQYGGECWITMLDTEGKPFCLVKREEKSGTGLTLGVINFDCKTYENLREFYSQLTNWNQPNPYVLEADINLIINFMGCDGDFDYIPPVWPEEPGKQQKQMHFNFQVDDLHSAVEAAVSLGAKKAEQQYGEHYVVMIDPEGHPFCLCE